MKKTLQYTFLLLVLWSSNVLAQTEELSPTAKYLKSRVEAGDYDAILEAGNSGDLTLIPYLKQLVSNAKARSNSNSSAYEAHIALAKLGGNDALQQILAEIDAENPDVQDNAMKKLSLVGGKEAFKKFYQLLDDTAPRENPKCKKSLENFKKNHPEGENCGFCCDVVYFSRSVSAILLLSNMIDNPPVKGGAWDLKKNVQLWKEWFAKNKHLIE